MRVVDKLGVERGHGRGTLQGEGVGAGGYGKEEEGRGGGGLDRDVIPGVGSVGLHETRRETRHEPRARLGKPLSLHKQAGPERL